MVTSSSPMGTSIISPTSGTGPDLMFGTMMSVPFLRVRLMLEGTIVSSATKYTLIQPISVDALEPCMSLQVVGEEAGGRSAIVFATIVVGLAGCDIVPTRSFVFHGNHRMGAAICRSLDNRTAGKRDRRRNGKQRAHSITSLWGCSALLTPHQPIWFPMSWTKVIVGGAACRLGSSVAHRRHELSRRGAVTVGNRSGSRRTSDQSMR